MSPGAPSRSLGTPRRRAGTGMHNISPVGTDETPDSPDIGAHYEWILGLKRQDHMGNVMAPERAHHGAGGGRHD